MIDKKLIIRIIGLFLMIVTVFSAVIIIGLVKAEDVSSVSYGVIDLGTTTDCIGLTARMGVSLFYDSHRWGSCSCAVKTLENGDTIAGRNLDMTLSNTPVYVGKTDIDGYYETIYAFYVPEFGPDYDECMEKGVPGYVAKTIPFTALDSLNSEGLYIQINMRQDQTDESGNYVFACSHTNEDADTRISAVEIPTYVTLRCKNVDEAIELINSLDIYTLGEDINWPFSYIIADSDGNCGVLELGCNKAVWTPNQNIQTNFYICEDLGAIQKYKQGIGRYDYLEENLSSVDSQDEMLSLMENVKYSSIYDLSCDVFDIRSEMAGDKEQLTNEYLDNEDNWNNYKEEYKDEVDTYLSLSDSERRDANKYWVSAYTVVVNCTKKTFSFSFFEDYDAQFSLEFSVPVEDSNSKISTYVVVSLELFSILVSVILIYANSFETRKVGKVLTKRQRVFSISLVTNIIGLITDAISWYYDGNTEHPLLVKYSTGLATIITYVMLAEFCMYLCSILQERENINVIAFNLFITACLVAVVITLVMFEAGLLYTVTNGEYFEAPLYVFYSTMNGVFIFVSITIVFFYRRILGIHDFIVILIYTILPAISSLVCLAFPELSLGYPACTIAYLFIYVMLQSDTTSKLTNEKNIYSYNANHDELTGLYSRRYYIETIDNFKNSESDETLDGNVGVVFSDINGLKYTNDNLGHIEGDNLLTKYADTVKEVFPENSIFRISGDEFVILLRGISREELTAKAAVLEEKLSHFEFPLACIGCAYGTCQQIDEIVRSAESKMYVRKEEFYAKFPEMRR